MATRYILLVSRSFSPIPIGSMYLYYTILYYTSVLEHYVFCCILFFQISSHQSQLLCPFFLVFLIYSVEIRTRWSFVIEFIIPEFTEGSTRFERHTAHHQELQTVFAASGLYTHVVTGGCQGWVGRSPHGYINERPQIQFRAPDDERCATRNMLSLQ